jgi:predicted rRNA methylase YqxC with S4 and FtsJ domains
MPDYDQLKAEMEAIQKKMDIAKKLERKNALKTVKKLCKEFGFTASMLKDSLTEGRKRKS